MMKYALIVAGGSGSRMQSTTPKQFIEVGSLPILMRAIRAFYQYSQEIKIIVVIPEEHFTVWSKLVENHHFNIPCQLVKGGKTRFESVKNGLHSVENEGLVAIHDGVRPFITSQLIDQCYKSADEYGSGVAAVIPKDSIRELTESGNRTLNRHQYRLIQTPQTFEVSIIKQAYLSTGDIGFTDDASVAENVGIKISLVEGDYSNIKITTPEDIKIAQALLEKDFNESN
jgi:2-C-methyl-D-erythritol 4-phosphate cytidylyltransferase